MKPPLHAVVDAALREVGAGTAHPEAGHNGRIFGATRTQSHKAIAIAKMSLDGPEALIVCRRCAIVGGHLNSGCRKITAADALIHRKEACQ